MFEGEVLVGAPDDHSLDQVGHETIQEYPDGEGCPQRLAAELGGCAGNVHEKDIDIVRLVNRLLAADSTNR